jgi:hypothetical protein
MNFWQKLKKPIIVLAPMADVTDVSFRCLFAKYGKPDVTWTEFVSADGLIMAPGDNPDDTGLSSKQKAFERFGIYRRRKTNCGTTFFWEARDDGESGKTCSRTRF